MLTWKEVIELIDPEEKPGFYLNSSVEQSELITFSDLYDVRGYYNSEFSLRMLKHWVSSWVCTDTRVGVAVYCLDKVPVAVSYQSARKSKEVIKFLTEASRIAVRDCVMQYVEMEGELVNLDEKIPVFFFDQTRDIKNSFINTSFSKLSK